MSEEEITTIKRYFENKDYTINGIKVHDVIQEMTDLIEKQQEEIKELQAKLEIEKIDNKYNQEERDEETIPRYKIREKIKKAKEINWHTPKLVIEYFEELLKE